MLVNKLFECSFTLIYIFILTCSADRCAFGNERCFTLITDQPLDWFPAEEYCETHFNGFLASIRNAFEKSIIQSLLQSATLNTNVYIGGFRTGSSPFQWSDGTSFQYNQFAPGQPTSDGNFIQICRQEETGCQFGQWKAVPRGDQMASFLCEYDGGSNSSPSSGPSTSRQPSTQGQTTVPTSSQILTRTAPTSTPNLPSTTSSMAFSTGPCTPQTTVRPAVPCPVNIVILIDGSNGMTADQFTYQTTFISTIFSNTWTYDEIGIAIGLYDDTDPTDFDIVAPFGAITNAITAGQLVQAAFQESGTASITTALKMTLKSFPDGLPCLPQRTFLFTSTSVDADITSAVPYANQLKAMGSLVIIAMGPNADATKLQTLGSQVITWPDFSNVPGNLGSSITSAMCPIGP